MKVLSRWHSRELQDIVQISSVDPTVGLSEEESVRRLEKFGLNRLVEEREIRFLDILREEITEPMILLLIVVGVVYSVLGSISEKVAHLAPCPVVIVR